MMIYCITNKLNNKKYIGQTRQTLIARWRRHCWKCTASHMAISLAIQKYGKENFIIEKICECYSIDELCDKEVYYIKIYNTLSPNGYNLTPGGETVIHPPETIARIAAKNRGKLVSKETRDKLRQAALGRKQTIETIVEKSIRMKGKRLSKKAQENSIMSCAKTYIMLNPLNHLQTITNMSKFCSQNGLSKFKMCEVSRGRRTAYRGWRLPA